MESRNQLGLRFRHVEGKSVGLRESAHHEEDEREREWKNEPESELLLAPDDLGERDVPPQDEDGHQAETQGDLVADHLCARAQTTQKRVLVVRRPTAQDEPVHPERAQREDVQDPDRDVGDDHVDRPEGRRQRCGERDHREKDQRGCHGQHGAQDEEQTIGRARLRLFLEEVLDPVRDGLQEPERPDPVRAHAILDPGAHASLRERRVHDGQHEDREDRGHLEPGARQEEPERKVVSHDGRLQLPSKPTGSFTVAPIRPRSL